MFPYTVKDTEFEYDIQNNNWLYKINQKHQNTFEVLENVGKFRKNYYLKQKRFIILYI